MYIKREKEKTLPNNAQQEENWTQKEGVRCQEIIVSKKLKTHMGKRKRALSV